MDAVNGPAPNWCRDGQARLQLRRDDPAGFGQPYCGASPFLAADEEAQRGGRAEQKAGKYYGNYQIRDSARFLRTIGDGWRKVDKSAALSARFVYESIHASCSA
jgi:hypothetical protein